MNEALLLDHDLHIVGSPLIREVVRGLKRARSALSFVKDGAPLPCHRTLGQLLLLFQSQDYLTSTQELSVLGILRHHRIRNLGDL